MHGNLYFPNTTGLDEIKQSLANIKGKTFSRFLYMYLKIVSKPLKTIELKTNHCCSFLTASKSKGKGKGKGRGKVSRRPQPAQKQDDENLQLASKQTFL